MSNRDPQEFGVFDGGQTAQLFRLKNANGIELAATDLGAIITEFHTPDRQGKSGDIILGYDTADAYFKDSSHMGAIAVLTKNCGIQPYFATRA